MNTTIPTGLTTAAAGTTLQSTSKAEQQKSQFLRLLVAQLKGQNPLDPKDGTEFITQLAQFSSLEELINIRTALEKFQNVTRAGNPFQPGV